MAASNTQRNWEAVCREADKDYDKKLREQPSVEFTNGRTFYWPPNQSPFV